MEAPEKTIQKLQIEVILLSFVILIGGMLWTWQIGMAANVLDHRLDHATEDLNRMQQNVRQMEAKRA